VFAAESLQGIIPPLLTPLTPAEEIDEQGLRSLINYVLAAGVHGVFVLGNMGECALLTERARVRAIEVTVETVNGRVPVIAGISDIGTKKVIEHCRVAQKAGADFVMATAPYYMPMRTEAVYTHFRQVALETGARLLIYNVPPVISSINPEVIARLAEIENIVGVKDSADITHVQEVIFRTRGRGFRIFVGSAPLLAAGLLLGAQGGTCSPANLYPQVYLRIFESVRAGKIAEALELQERANNFEDTLDSVSSNPFTPLKMAAHLLGLCGPTVTAPYPPLTAEETESVREVLRRFDLLP